MCYLICYSIKNAVLIYLTKISSSAFSDSAAATKIQFWLCSNVLFVALSILKRSKLDAYYKIKWSCSLFPFIFIQSQKTLYIEFSLDFL